MVETLFRLLKRYNEKFHSEEHVGAWLVLYDDGSGQVLSGDNQEEVGFLTLEEGVSRLVEALWEHK